jgi:hypothetical protein
LRIIQRGHVADKQVRDWVVVVAASIVAPCIDGVPLTSDLSWKLQTLRVDACSRFQCGGTTDAFDVVPCEALCHAGNYDLPL